ncbi:helix-turn-helix domain-containing protein [Pedobacter chitinilyticus]|uniref:AraC family transcriptional regulator n=2 Tax=Pedobacter chitinilyticus TaxID=2233776 RepID=A0A443YKM8_9SPHI|nr:helix-turn-helix domain-containing protein [Pedobacter chitinilyticus]RWU04302.1 AraC family transcriptional regulator [Pedobacter chitinilyticus]
MEMEFYRPLHKDLSKFIEGYYFISPGQNPKPLHYWTFPNNFFIVSVSKDTEIEMQESKFVIKPSSQPNIIANYVARYTAPIEILCEGAVNEITIYFKPLGINRFVDDSQALLKQKSAKDFNPFVDFLSSMQQLFEERDRNLQREQLEQYWLSKLNSNELGLMESILADVEADLKIDDIAQNRNFSRQYLNKVFTKNIGKPAAEYRKIHRFRKTVINQREAKNLTELSYDSLFYDQSHLVKDFKQLTHVNPYAFFKKVDTQQGNLWLFI